ncbi:DMT family transporter [Paenibacillus alginolyticus]|uniref:DMT family transporter n=1 Tax=Paenibacillus alginolyticus TaxID=59839 RepID=A0ABT4GKN9_9BACL|nr:DMT family transporter [Paenibacillus alginolyticus]MCY9670176.1 DMT family transporter [Paenibacillus alginolyticus]MCY9696603.1 DMT family transporter [Paenibacillus alginolyticus]MEC0145214.1 DMT family transporter [Paenibacillus alginolyticus]
MAKSYLILVFCVFIWALNYIVRQILLREFSPFFLSAFSLTVVSFTFLIWAFVTKSFVKLTRKEIVFFLLSAVIGLIANQILLFKGLERTSATNASLIFTLSPLITAGLAAVFLKEKITWRMVAGCLVAIIGLIQALNMHGLLFSTGDWIMLGATFTFSCNLIFARVLSRRLSPFIVTVYSFMISAVFFDPFILSVIKMDWNHSIGIWGLAIVSVIVGQGITGVMWNKGMESIGAARAVIVLNLQPLMTMLLEFLIFHHLVAYQQVFGAILVFIGVLIGTMQKGFFTQKQKEKRGIIYGQQRKKTSKYF